MAGAVWEGEGIAPVDTVVYTFIMSEKAKLFTNGGSQAVRLPKSCRFPDDQREVLVRREGNRVILEPANEWPQEVLDLIGTFDEDEVEIPARTSSLENPFDK